MDGVVDQGLPCLAISGSSDGNVTGMHLVTTLTSYPQSEDACPAVNGELNVKDVDDDASIDIRFLGGPRGAITAVDGTVTDLPLACGKQATPFAKAWPSSRDGRDRPWGRSRPSAWTDAFMRTDGEARARR